MRKSYVGESYCQWNENTTVIVSGIRNFRRQNHNPHETLSIIALEEMNVATASFIKIYINVWYTRRI